MCVCLSRSLNAAEKNYDSYRGEMMAVVWACKSLRCYLHGRFFTLVTDHKPLTSLMANKNLVGQHSRWALALQEFDFEVLHREGRNHLNADALSRFPITDATDCSGARLNEDGDPEPQPPKVVYAMYRGVEMPAVPPPLSNDSWAAAQEHDF